MDAETVSRHLETAREAEAAGDFSGALRSYERRVEEQPDDAEALYGVVRNASRLGIDARTISAARMLLTLVGPDWELHARTARAFLRQGCLDEAREEIDQALDLAQSNIDRSFALTIRARVEQALVQPAAALLSLQMAVDADPAHLDAHALLIEALLDAGLADPAERLARGLLVDRPDAGAIWIKLGRALLRRNRTLEAIEALWTARALMDDRSIDVELACAAGRLGRWTEVVEHVQSALSGPLDAEAKVKVQIYMAHALENSGRLNDALDQLQIALTDGVLIEHVLYDIARLERKLGSTNSAISHLYSILKLNPADAIVVEMLSQWLVEEGRAEELLAFLTASPLQEEFQHYVLLCLHLLGRDAALLEKAWGNVNKNPGMETAWAALGLAFRVNQDDESARAAVALACSLAPASEEARWFQSWPRNRPLRT